jgi:hypothetical protein
MKKVAVRVPKVPFQLFLFILTLMLLSTSGCASLKADIPFAYTPSLRMGETIEGKAVFQQIEDLRSKKHRRSTREIPDCADKLTSKLVEDFRSTRLFGDVDYSPNPAEADFIITGRLEKFSWNAFFSPTYYIPVVSLIHLFGVPVVSFTGEVQLTLDVRAAGAASPRQYTGSARNKTFHNVYELKAAEGGVELQFALRDAVKQIKEQMAKDGSPRSPGG